MSSSTKDLKRVLGRVDLFSIAIGQMVGAGIMTLVGIAIGQTGKSVNVAFVLSAIMLCIMYIPNIVVGGTARLRGGRYTQTALFAGKNFSGVFIILHIASNVMIAMYAISFAQYFKSIVPAAPEQLVAIGILTVFYLINIVGVKEAAKVQTAMMVILVLALLTFTVVGVPNIKPGYFEGPEFMSNGVGGLLGAGALLTFALAGGDSIVQMSGEAKNPTKDIPFVLIVSTIIMAVLYAVMSTVAAGILPIDQVAGQPLSVVAKSFLQEPLFSFFVIGGALFALATTLNATLGWVTKPVIQACDDGWFPKKLGHLHPKFKTPVYLLTLFYIVGVIPIILNISLDELSMATLIFYYGTIIFTTTTLFKLPKVMPEIWNKSRFKTSDTKLIIFSIVSSLSCIFQISILFGMITTRGKIVIVAILVFAIVYTLLRSSKAEIQESHEAD